MASHVKRVDGSLKDSKNRDFICKVCEKVVVVYVCCLLCTKLLHHGCLDRSRKSKHLKCKYTHADERSYANDTEVIN